MLKGGLLSCEAVHNMNCRHCSLNSLNRGSMGEYIGDYHRGY